jgi:hypothetical protein
MKNILSTYELASGQAISLPKSEIYCSRNVPSDLQTTITRGGKKIRARGYPRIKSVMGTGRVAKRVPAGKINGYFTTRYFMGTDTDLMIPVPAGIRTR